MNDSGINIQETSEFDEVSSYYKSISSMADSLIDEVSDGSSYSYDTELSNFYNSELAKIVEKINSFKNEVSRYQGHLDNSLMIYYVADQKMSSKIDDLYDAIFNDEDYQEQLMYAMSDKSESLSYDEYVTLLDESEEFFNNQREEVYNKFMVKVAVASPTLIEKIGTKAYDSVVETAYYFISDDKIGSKEYNNGLIVFKDNFGREILVSYDDIDFIPECYLDGKKEYDVALLALAFDTDLDGKETKIKDAFYNIDERTHTSDFDYFVDTRCREVAEPFDNLKEILADCDYSDPKKALEYFYNETSNLLYMNDLSKPSGDYFISSYLFDQSPDAWYDAIKDTQAFERVKDLVGDDKTAILNMTNNIDFLSAVYKYDGMNALLELYNDYIENCPSQYDFDKKMVLNSGFDTIIRFAVSNEVTNSLYETTLDTQNQLNVINDNEESSLLLFTKQLDVSDVTDTDAKNANNKISDYWNRYCDGNDCNKYLEDWELKAYAKVLKENPELAGKLFNLTEGKDRGILDEKIMEGYAFDVAKKRVEEMSVGGDLASDINRFIFSSAYGFGYGLTGFTDGFADIWNADGKVNRRQMEQSNIMALLANDYTLYSKYAHGDSDVVSMLSPDYSDEVIKNIKFENLTDDDIDDLIKECKDNKVPRYELEYYAGLISYEEYTAYKNLANASPEDLEYYANLGDNQFAKSISEKIFKVSNSVGNMAIPTVLNILATATGGVGSVLLNTASYGLLFGSSYGRTKEELMQSGETDDLLIRTNAFLHAGLETFGEAAFGKIMKSPKWGVKLKDAIAKVPGLGTLINASDDLNDFLLRSNCNPRLAKYLSNIVGEVIQENGENLFGWGIDATTNALGTTIKMPSLEEALQETWETSWMTAFTTPILNSMTDLSLCNVKRVVNINGTDIEVSLSDMLLFTDEETNTIDYDELSKYLMKKNGKESLVTISAQDSSIDGNFNLYYLPGQNKYLLESSDGSVLMSDNLDTLKDSARQLTKNDSIENMDNSLNNEESIIPDTQKDVKKRTLLDKLLMRDEYDFNKIDAKNKYGKNSFGLLSYLIRNGALESDINSLARKTKINKDIKAIQADPSKLETMVLDQLNGIYKNGLVYDSDGKISGFDISKVDTETFDKYYSISSILARDVGFRTNNTDILKQIAKVADYVGNKLIYDGNYKSYTTPNGMTINLIGENSEVLKTTADNILKAYDMLSPEVKQQYDGHVINLRDQQDYDGLGSLMRYYLNDEKAKEFISAGGFVNADGNYYFYNDMYKIASVSKLIGTMNHEAGGHALDNYISSLYGDKDGFFTTAFPFWQNVVNSENENGYGSVSSYGDTKVYEDFAETARAYEADSEGFTKAHPLRTDAFKLVRSIGNSSALTLDGKLDLVWNMQKNGIYENGQGERILSSSPSSELKNLPTRKKIDTIYQLGVNSRGDINSSTVGLFFDSFSDLSTDDKRYLFNTFDNWEKSYVPIQAMMTNADAETIARLNNALNEYEVKVENPDGSVSIDYKKSQMRMFARSVIRSIEAGEAPSLIDFMRISTDNELKTILSDALIESDSKVDISSKNQGINESPSVPADTAPASQTNTSPITTTGFNENETPIAASVRENLDNIVKTMDNKYGTGIKALRNYVEFEDPTVITRTNDARSLISKIDIKDIKQYLFEFDLKQSFPSIQEKNGDSNSVNSQVDNQNIDSNPVTPQVNNQNVVSLKGESQVEIKEQGNTVSPSNDQVQPGMYGLTEDEIANKDGTTRSYTDSMHDLKMLDELGLLDSENEQDRALAESIFMKSTATVADSTYGKNNATLKQNGNWYQNSQNAAKYYGQQGINTQEGSWNKYTDAIWNIGRITDASFNPNKAVSKTSPVSLKTNVSNDTGVVNPAVVVTTVADINTGIESQTGSQEQVSIIDTNNEVDEISEYQKALNSYEIEERPDVVTITENNEEIVNNDTVEKPVEVVEEPTKDTMQPVEDTAKKDLEDQLLETADTVLTVAENNVDGTNKIVLDLNAVVDAIQQMKDELFAKLKVLDARKAALIGKTETIANDVNTLIQNDTPQIDETVPVKKQDNNPTSEQKLIDKIEELDNKTQKIIQQTNDLVEETNDSLRKSKLAEIDSYDSILHTKEKNINYFMEDIRNQIQSGHFNSEDLDYYPMVMNEYMNQLEEFMMKNAIADPELIKIFNELRFDLSSIRNNLLYGFEGLNQTEKMNLYLDLLGKIKNNNDNIVNFRNDIFKMVASSI